MRNTEDCVLFSQHQRNHIVSVFRHIDTLLQVLESIASGRSEGLFPDYTPDLAPAEISALMTFVSELRAKMADKLTAYGFGSAAAKTTAKHAAHSTLTFITIAVDELRPRNVRGYGELTEKATRELETLVAELDARTSSAARALAHTTEGVSR